MVRTAELTGETLVFKVMPLLVQKRHVFFGEGRHL